jgi:hypothetical protein
MFAHSASPRAFTVFTLIMDFVIFSTTPPPPLILVFFPVSITGSEGSRCYSSGPPAFADGSSRKQARTTPVTHTAQAHIAMERITCGRENARIMQGKRERYALYPRNHLRQTVVRPSLLFICCSLAISVHHPSILQQS